MENINILVVDDDLQIMEVLCKLLELEGYKVHSSFNGFEAIDYINNKSIQLVILDVMMPHLNGLTALLKIREKHNVPIIMLSAKTEETDKVCGLSLGADDYIEKPFNTAELLARVKAQLRRYMLLGASIENAAQTHDLIEVGDLVLNQATKEILVCDIPYALTATEYKILELLMKHPNQVFSAEQIYENVWQETVYAVENTVMVHIRRIREKIEMNPKEPKYLKVVWGIGYKIER